ncbi:MAG: hypothetical protein M3065_06610, partial [Actinomycetota bacterium]|nr:hypothetical protein [Actinomycetota bacterium]
MASWLSFWNADLRSASAGDTGSLYDSAYVPWGLEKLDAGDTVFAVGIENGRLILITDLLVSHVEPSLDAPGQVDIDSSRSRVPIDFHRIVPDRTVDRLSFLM